MRQLQLELSLEYAVGGGHMLQSMGFYNDKYLEIIYHLETV